MLSGPYQGRLLALLSKMIQPRHILEVGTFTGYSCICLAEGLAENGRITTIEKAPELAHFITENLSKAGLLDYTDLHIGQALHILPALNETFDLVFLDADKQHYPEYFDLIYPKLRAGGVLIADNVLWSGKVWDDKHNDKETQALRTFNNLIAKHPGLDKVMLPIRDGIAIVRKK